jgi:FdrA protein
VEKVLEVVEECQKPVVVNFLGGAPASKEGRRVTVARTLEDAAVEAVSLLTGDSVNEVRKVLSVSEAAGTAEVQRARAGLAPSQQYVRGLFCGGTFCSEATMVLRDLPGGVHTNGRVAGAHKLADPRWSVGHTCVDLGEDIFTVGKPHPMLEPSLRRERLLQEAGDPETAVILLDVPIGFGVHADPAGLAAGYILEAKEVAARANRSLPVIVSVCGVDADPQNRGHQIEKLVEVGAIVLSSNARAAYVAGQIAGGLEG